MTLTLDPTLNCTVDRTLDCTLTVDCTLTLDLTLTLTLTLTLALTLTPFLALTLFLFLTVTLALTLKQACVAPPWTRSDRCSAGEVRRGPPTASARPPRDMGRPPWDIPPLPAVPTCGRLRPGSPPPTASSHGVPPPPRTAEVLPGYHPEARRLARPGVIYREPDRAHRHGRSPVAGPA